MRMPTTALRRNGCSVGRSAIGREQEPARLQANSLVPGSTLFVRLRPGVRYRSPQSDQLNGER